VSSPAIVHSYPLAVRNCGLFSAFGLLLRSLPYALIRFAVLLAFSFASIIWVVLTLGGSVWLGAHVAPAFGWVWFISGALLAGWFWMASLRYFLHLIECGHVAVLTQLIVRGRVGNGTESMFAYGRRIVTEHFGQVNVLFAMNLLVRGVLNAFHRTLDWIAEVLPIPGLGAIANLLTAILRAATRYMDKVILSYNLARNDANPWNSARDGIVYLLPECQANPENRSLDRRRRTGAEHHPVAAPAWARRGDHRHVAAICAWSGRAPRDHRGAVRACGTRRLRQAAIPHHDPGAISHGDRGSTHPPGLGRAAGPAVQ
jgi:hypothetical protein